MGEAALKIKSVDLVQQALDQMYSEKSRNTLESAKRILRRHGVIFIHAEPPGGTPVDGSVIRVVCEHKLESSIEEAFVNAEGLVVDRQQPHIWFSQYK